MRQKSFPRLSDTIAQETYSWRLLLRLAPTAVAVVASCLLLKMGESSKCCLIELIIRARE